jgi:hypothetical protein
LTEGAYDSLDDDEAKLQAYHNAVSVKVDDLQAEIAQGDLEHAPILAELVMRLNSSEIVDDDGEGQFELLPKTRRDRTMKVLKVAAVFLGIVSVLLLTMLLVSHSRLDDTDLEKSVNEFDTLTPGTPPQYKPSYPPPGSSLSPFRQKSDTQVGCIEAFSVLILVPVLMPTLDYVTDLLVTGTWFASPEVDEQCWADYSSLILGTTVLVNLLFWFGYRDIIGSNDPMFFKNSIGMNTAVGFLVTAFNLRAQAMAAMLFYRVVVLARPAAKAVQKLLRSIALATLINFAVETVPQMLLQGYAAMLRYYQVGTIEVVEKELVVSLVVGLTTLTVGLVRAFCKRDSLLTQSLAFLFFSSFLFMRFALHSCVFVEFIGPGDTTESTAYFLVIGSIFTRIIYVQCTASSGTSLGVVMLDVFLTYFTPVGMDTAGGKCCCTGSRGALSTAGKGALSSNGSRVLHPDRASRAHYTIVSQDGYRLLGLHVFEGLVAAMVVSYSTVAHGEVQVRRHDLAIWAVSMSSVNVCALAALAVITRHSRRQSIGAQRGINVNQSTGMSGQSLDYDGMSSPAPASMPGMAPQSAALSPVDGNAAGSALQASSFL